MSLTPVPRSRFVAWLPPTVTTHRLGSHLADALAAGTQGEWLAVDLFADGITSCHVVLVDGPAIHISDPNGLTQWRCMPLRITLSSAAAPKTL